MCVCARARACFVRHEELKVTCFLILAQNENPAGYTLKRNTAFYYNNIVPRRFMNTTAEVCQSLCEKVYDYSCCTLVFIRERTICYITAVESSTENVTLSRKEGVDLYIRNKCSGIV